MADEAVVPVATAPAVRVEFYQTDTHVTIEIMVKKVDPAKSVIEITPKAVDVSAKLISGDDYKRTLSLSFEIIPEQSSFKIMSTKIEIKLKKLDGIRWEKLEGDDQKRPLPAPIAPAEGQSASAIPSKYPSSSKKAKDWDKLDFEDEKEEGLDQLFQKIYSEGSDEIKKAMNKSFSESNGTVLSTNWGEIGHGKVDMKPPDGQEFKKWE